MQKMAWLEAALEDGVEIHEPDSLEDYSRAIQIEKFHEVCTDRWQNIPKREWNQHESVLCISSFQKMMRVFKIR